MRFYIVLNSYGHVFVIETKEYNEKVKKLLEWGYDSYLVEVIIKNPDSVEFECGVTLETKADIIKELESNRMSHYWDESKEKIEENIECIKSFLVE